MNTINAAEKFARKVHKKQFRKWQKSEIPYITHVQRVAKVIEQHLKKYRYSHGFYGCTDWMIQVAWLHDVIEYGDNITEFTLRENEFYDPVAKTVVELTNQFSNWDLPRNIRESMEAKRLGQVSREAKLIKLIDRIDNINDIKGAKISFQDLYCRESLELLSHIGDISRPLAEELYLSIKEVQINIKPILDIINDNSGN